MNDIAAHFDISQQAVSQHLHVLKNAGLVDVEPDGTRRLYVVRVQGLEEIDAYLSRLWPTALQRLKTSVEHSTPRRDR